MSLLDDFIKAQQFRINYSEQGGYSTYKSL